MMRLFRRRPTFGRNSYYRSVKRRRIISPRWLIISLPILLVLLELLARLLVGVAGKRTEFEAASGHSKLANTYRLLYLTEDQKKISGLPQQGQLRVARSVGQGYELLGGQEQGAWQINAQGFRDDEDVPLAKPNNEFRIFLLGNSTAFGQGNQGNGEMLAHQLEIKLNNQIKDQQQSPKKYRPDVFPFFVPDRVKAFQLKPKLKLKQYRVINAAVPGYASGNQVAQLGLQILPYQPDLIIVLDGYMDLLLPSDRPMQDIPYISDYLADAPSHFRRYAGQAFQNWLQQSYLVKGGSYLFPQSEAGIAEQTLTNLPDPKPLNRYLPEDEEELKQRSARYQANHQQLVKLSAGANSAVIFALQPEITGRSPDNLSPEEQQILQQLGQAYAEQVATDYVQFSQANQTLAETFPNYVRALDLYGATEKLPEQAFLDPIHLNAVANEAIASMIFLAIIDWEKFHLIPQNYVLKKE